MSYPSLNDIVLSLRVGKAIAVIVEGEAIGSDAWVYGTWFGARSREILFFPQDGWQRVQQAVAELRKALPDYPIYGIIDRDVTPDDKLDNLIPIGVYQSRLYSVENYLLRPECWNEVLKLVCRPHGGTPMHWRTQQDIEDRIIECYSDLIPTAAFNRVIGLAARANPALPGKLSYASNLQDQRLVDPKTVLRDWSRGFPDTQNLELQFDRELEIVSSSGKGWWPRLIDGKMVLSLLLNRFNAVKSGHRYAELDYVNHYLDRCPEPPDEAVALIERIVMAGRNFGGTGDIPSDNRKVG